MINEQQELKRQAETLRDQKRFPEAVVVYEKLWLGQAENPDVWVGWRYGQCLRKVGRSADALEICRAIYRLDPTFDRNNNLYGWCIYDIGIKQAEEELDEAKFTQAANAIVQLTRHEDYSPYERTVFAVVHHYEKYKDRQKPVPTQKSWGGSISSTLFYFPATQIRVQMEKRIPRRRRTGTPVGQKHFSGLSVIRNVSFIAPMRSMS